MDTLPLVPVVSVPAEERLEECPAVSEASRPRPASTCGMNPHKMNAFLGLSIFLLAFIFTGFIQGSTALLVSWVMDGCLLSRLWITQRPISVQAANKNPMPPMVKTSSRQTPSLLSAARLSLLLFWELQIINLQVSVPEEEVVNVPHGKILNS